ncbi:hypothetical protein VKT23_001290 [Stygiomarasmius scandens]|uniref:Uncharacterized protein n=1 Tax=Marasmiellus scandens TaxID=2682957 RepID=A0ABR1KCJ9_9AGAR
MSEASLVTPASTNDRFSRIAENNSIELMYHQLPSDVGSVLSTNGAVAASSRFQQASEKKDTGSTGNQNTRRPMIETSFEPASTSVQHSSISPTLISHNDKPNSDQTDTIRTNPYQSRTQSPQWIESTVSTAVERRSSSMPDVNQSPYRSQLSQQEYEQMLMELGRLAISGQTQLQPPPAYEPRRSGG